MATDTKLASATRRFFLRAAVVGCLVMALVSVLPTYFGLEAAEKWFVSPFGATVWWAFALLIVVSMVAVQALRRRLGLLAMHLGMVLVVVGALWGSPMMHRLRARLWDDPKHHKGFLKIYEGHSSRELLDPNGRPIAQFPYDVHLEDFTIEYYPLPKDEQWVFVVDAVASDSPSATGMGMGMGEVWHSAVVEWDTKKKVPLPLCDIDMLVTEYKLFQYGDADSPVMAEAEVTLSRGKYRTEEVFGPKAGSMRSSQLPLAGLYESAKAWHAAGKPYLRFLPPRPIIKDYKSALVVFKDGREIARKTIEVNDPLYIDGYHLYQQSYDHQEGRYTVLAVASDSGLSLVYVGFILLVGGLAVHVLLPKRRAGKAGA